MREQLETLNYQQLLKVAREYNKAVSVPLPTNVSKEELVKYILTHAKDVGKLIEILGGVREEKAPVLPKVKSRGMDEDERMRAERKRERGLRAIERAKLKYESIVEGEPMTKQDDKKYKAEVKAIKAKFK
jgi:hypothetical protein